jgi:uncharacterized protein (TIGR04552 family)
MTPDRKEQLRYVLSGVSAIDWPRLDLKTEDEINRFLKKNEFDVTRAGDLNRLKSLYLEALDYLKNHLEVPVADSFNTTSAVLDLFLGASQSEDASRQQTCCALLKIMNVMNHIDGHELLYHCQLSPRDFFSVVEDKIMRGLTYLQAHDTPLVGYEGGRKTKKRLVTKLLSEQSSQAVKIYDRLRFNLVAQSLNDVPTVINALFDHLLPINYLTANASINQLLVEFQNGAITATENDSTGSSYKVIKFMVDVPVRLDQKAVRLDPHMAEILGHVAFSLVEFQIVDQTTHETNNAGDNEHSQYKSRQHASVRQRLIS